MFSKYDAHFFQMELKDWKSQCRDDQARVLQLEGDLKRKEQEREVQQVVQIFY